jgi:hypothetical protein
MKAKLLSISAALLFILVIIACKKNTAGPKIELKLKSVNATSFSPGQTLKFTFEFTPKTTNADTLFIARKFFTCPFITTDTSKFDFPEFDNNSKGELVYSFQYGSGGAFNGCISNTTGLVKTDSLNYFFWVKDKEGNVSDTIVSPKIILLK